MAAGRRVALPSRVHCLARPWTPMAVPHRARRAARCGAPGLAIAACDGGRGASAGQPPTTPPTTPPATPPSPPLSSGATVGQRLTDLLRARVGRELLLPPPHVAPASSAPPDRASPAALRRRRDRGRLHGLRVLRAHGRAAGRWLDAVRRCCSSVSSTSSDVPGVTMPNWRPVASSSSWCRSGKTESAATFCWAQRRATRPLASAAACRRVTYVRVTVAPDAVP